MLKRKNTGLKSMFYNQKLLFLKFHSYVFFSYNFLYLFALFKNLFFINLSFFPIHLIFCETPPHLLFTYPSMIVAFGQFQVVEII